MFRNVTLKCINEIGGLELSREYDDKFVILHDMAMSSLRRIIPLETGMSLALSYPDINLYDRYSSSI
jgi:exportin-1